jgi:hypothetical protein
MNDDEQHREGEEAIRSAGGRSREGRPVEPSEHAQPPPPAKVRAIPLGMPVPEEEYRTLKEDAERPVAEPQEDSAEIERRSRDDSKED